MIRIILFSAIFSLLGWTQGFGQCQTEQYTHALMEKFPEGYSYLKSFPVKKQNASQGKIELPYFFNKNSTYLISFLGQEAELTGVILTLYDADRNLVATTKDPGSQKYLSDIQYNCASTGVYYLSFSFENQDAYCAGAVIGFKR